MRVRSGATSPLTPALSPLRGEEDEPVDAPVLLKGEGDEPGRICAIAATPQRESRDSSRRAKTILSLAYSASRWLIPPLYVSKKSQNLLPLPSTRRGPG